MLFNNETIDTRRELITKMLRQGVCEVTFTKINGETRFMPCTLSTDIVPPTIITESESAKRKKQPNESNMSVWCIDKNEWRSFKLANVIEVIPNE